MKKKIMIVEDYEEIRLLYKTIFRKDSELEIVAQLESGEDALDALKNISPDLILVDISLPGMNGIEFTKKIRKDYPSVKIVVASGFDADRYYDAAIKAGAEALIVKGNTDTLLDTIRTVLNR